MTTITSNIDEFEKKLSNFEKQITEDLLLKVGFRIEAGVVLEITTRRIVDTGRFRASIKARQYSPKKILISDGVTYGIWHEIGTHKMRARKPFYWALDKLGIQIREELKNIKYLN